MCGVEGKENFWAGGTPLHVKHRLITARKEVLVGTARKRGYE